MHALEHSISTYFGIEGDRLSTIANCFEREELGKSEFYTKAGSVCDKLSFIQSGYIRIFVDTGDKEVTQWVSSPGYFITELSSLLFQQRSRWNFQALTDCELYTIKGKDYYNLKNSVPEWHEIEKLFIAKCFTIVEDRVFSFLSKNAEERYQMLLENHPDIVYDVPQQYLASMIGITPETFSRLRKKVQ